MEIVNVIKNYAKRANEMVVKAIQRLKDLGAKQISIHGVKGMYLPGNVRINYSYPVDMYGTHFAANGRRHKSFLLANHLGKFRKGK